MHCLLDLNSEHLCILGFENTYSLYPKNFTSFCLFVCLFEEMFHVAHHVAEFNFKILILLPHPQSVSIISM